MPNPPTKPPSPSELAKLEHAFATDPSSDAYRPLAEAYLSAGRFMEAMVVCKKGVKTHPSAVQPRLNGAWVRLHPFFANDHRLHEAAGRQVGLGKRTVGIRGRIGGESVLELCELGGARRFRWGVGHAEAETLLLHSALQPVKGAKVRLPRSLDTELSVGYPTVAPKSFTRRAVIPGV